ncbi:hypothetical protein MFLO_14377 [Listeria floridensis FSL S10-1187]|uniref:SH3b domain-containing protein n=1 Tax=Listeria floridensis FSL S10-1187 TaxID=1265817 RepID=A0ABP3AW41_9LIST|nr:SH3 domain-containing protein [Listeria floridensis]EUJ26148.1 hypothetical protein MFLO_14377 [Listeria floridensis FSL S10-1187]
MVNPKFDRYYAETGTFTAHTNVAVKAEPTVKATQYDRITKGKKVNYHHVAFSSGYVWVEFKHANGKNMFACVGKADAANKRNALKYGAFE